MLLKLEGVIHVPQLELNIGYYHIDLSPGVKQFCTIVLPWVKCKYQNKSMGGCNCPNFSSKIYPNSPKVFIWYVRTYTE